MKRTSVVLLALLLLVSCALGPNFSRPGVETPETWRQPAGTGESIATLDWWVVFDDPVLQDLIKTALAENRDLRIAAARVDEAAAALGFTRADQFPSFRYDAFGGRAKTSDAIEGVPGATANEYQAEATVFWEIDLWGRLRRSTESARAQLLATEASQHGVVISLVASTTQLYFTLIDLDERLAISRRTLDSRHAATELIRSRFKGGIVGELDVHQAEIEEASAAVAVPSFEREIVSVETALAILLGRPPGDMPRGRPLDAARLATTIPAGLPADLLSRRPDLIEAEENAHAQMARIGVAEALRLPTLALTAAGGHASSDIDDFADSDAEFWSVGGSLFGPIFEFGKNKRRVEIERARTEQAVLRYENAVLTAFSDVENALAAVDTFAVEYAERVRQVESARAAARLSRARYDGGVTTYLEVLDIERSLFSSELALSETLQNRYTALVQLYLALGGGWTPN